MAFDLLDGPQPDSLFPLRMKSHAVEEALRDPRRLAVLKATGLLDAEALPALDRLTRLAARVLRVPVAQVNLLTADQQIPISHTGGEEWGIAVGLDRSFCQYAVADEEPLVIDDAREHPLVRDNAATIEAGIAAYAAVPVTPAGAPAPLATLCVVDFEPRHWTAEELETLHDLAACVESELELREARRRAENRADAASQALATERDQLRALFEQAPAAIAVTRGPEHVTRIANPRYLALVGGRDLIGQPAREALPELEGQDFFELLDRVYATGEPFVGNEMPASYDRDGDGKPEEAFFDFVYQPLFSPDGTVDGIMVHAVEVTEHVHARRGLQQQAIELGMQAEELRKQALRLEEVQAELEITNLELLERSEEAERHRRWLQLVLDHVPVGVILAEAPDGRITFGNRAIERIMRHPVLPSPTVEAYVEWVGFHPDGRRVQGREWPLARALAGETVPGEDVLYQRGDGTRGWIRISSAPVRDDNGQITGSIVAIADVDRERQSQAAAERNAALLSSVLDATRDPIFAKDLAGRYIAVNRALLPSFDRPAEQVLGRTDHDLLPSAVAAAVRESDEETLTAGEARLFEEQVPRSGEMRTYSSSKAPLLDADGQVIGVVGVARDITDQRNAEAERDRLFEEIARERGRLRQVFENAPAVMALYTGPEHIITLINPTWERTVGKPGATGKPFREVFPEFEATGLFEQLDDVYETGESFADPEVNLPLERWGSGVREDTYWNLVWLPLPPRDDDDSEREILVHAVEVTDQVLARRAIEAADRTKSEFLATMSHELRTPLNAMIGYVELLLLGLPEPIGDAARRQIERIGLSARHLLQIIEEILTFSRMAAGRERVHSEVVNLREITYEVRAIIQPLAAERELRFTVNAEEAPRTVWTDPRKLRQILVNLLGNAVKFTERGEVALTMRQEDEAVLFEVRDTGIGVAPEHYEQIFEPFWQADSSTRRAFGGTGLGLAVSRRLARLLDGDLFLESTPGEGSTFTLELPLGATPDAGS